MHLPKRVLVRSLIVYMQAFSCNLPSEEYWSINLVFARICPITTISRPSFATVQPSPLSRPSLKSRGHNAYLRVSAHLEPCRSRWSATTARLSSTLPTTVDLLRLVIRATTEIQSRGTGCAGQISIKYIIQSAHTLFTDSQEHCQSPIVLSSWCACTLDVAQWHSTTSYFS